MLDEEDVYSVGPQADVLMQGSWVSVQGYSRQQPPGLLQRAADALPY